MEKRNVLLHGNDRLAAAIGQRLIEAGWGVLRTDAEGVSRDLASADVLVLAADDDPGNADLALTARRARPDLPLVVRLFDDALAAHLRETLKGVRILSMSSVSAPAFVDAAQRAIASNSAERSKQPARKEPVGRFSRSGDRILLGAVAGLLALFITFTLFFSTALDLPLIDAMYFVATTVTTVGYGDIALREASAPVKFAGVILMFTGAAFLAVLFGLFTDRVVTRRLDILRGRVRVRSTGHVVIAGGGNVGFRTAKSLSEKGHSVVVIERDADNKNVEALRADGHHVILADAARPDILSLANVENAAAVVCVTDIDAVNFQIALLVRARNKAIPVVLRVVSPELSAHVSENGNAIAISPIAIASEEFSSTALAFRRKP